MARGEDTQRMRHFGRDRHQFTRPHRYHGARFGGDIFHMKFQFPADEVDRFRFDLVEMVAANRAFPQFNERRIMDRHVAIEKLRKFALRQQQAFARRGLRTRRTLIHGQAVFAHLTLEVADVRFDLHVRFRFWRRPIHAKQSAIAHAVMPVRREPD